MTTIVEKSDLELLKENRDLKQKVLNKYVKNFTADDAEVDEDQVHAFVRLADSVDDSIVKANKLKLTEEAINVNKNAQEQGLAFLKALHSADARTFASMDANTMVPDGTFTPTGDKVTGSEIIMGTDTQTLENFRADNMTEEE